MSVMDGLEWVAAGGAGVSTAAVIWIVLKIMPAQQQAFLTTIAGMLEAHTAVSTATRDAFAERARQDREATTKIVEALGSLSITQATLVESMRAATQWDGKERRGRQHVQAKEHPDERKPT